MLVSETKRRRPGARQREQGKPLKTEMVNERAEGGDLGLDVDPLTIAVAQACPMSVVANNGVVFGQGPEEALKPRMPPVDLHVTHPPRRAHQGRTLAVQGVGDSVTGGVLKKSNLRLVEHG